MEKLCGRCKKPNSELHSFVVPIDLNNEYITWVKKTFGPKEVEVFICQRCVSWMMRHSVKGK